MALPREKEFESLVLDGVARALWVHAYMIWAIEVEPPPYPASGGDDVTWDDIAPDNASTRAASMKAAKELARMLLEQNRLGRYPLAEIFARAVTARRGHPPGSPAAPQPGAGRGGGTEADLAYVFGEDVAHICMGTRDPGDSPLPFTRDLVIPHFSVELDDDGRHISWDGGWTWNGNGCNPCRANGDDLEVLVIEDDKDLKKMYPRMIRKIFPTAEVIIVDNYHAAIGYLETHPNIAHIISDVDIIGQKGGVDVFEWVQANRPELVDKYVFVTGGNPHVAKLHYRFLEKPISGAAELREMIERPAPGARTTSRTQAPARDLRPARMRPPTAAPRTVAPSRPPPVQAEQAIEAAFDRLDDGNNYVKLYDLRRQVPMLSREAFDAAMNNLRRAKIISLDSDDGRHVRLTEDERAAAIHEAGSRLVYAQRAQRREVPYQRTQAPPPPPPPPAGPDLRSVAQAVIHAMKSIEPEQNPDGRWYDRAGPDKVFISALWRVLETDPQFRGVTLDQFKRMLVDANRERLLNLARADLVAMMDPSEVRISEIRDRGATFHFVLDPAGRAR